MSLKGGILCDCNSFLISTEEELFVTGLEVESSKVDPSSQLNGLYSSFRAHGVLEG